MVWGTDWPQNCHLIKIHSFLSLDTYPKPNLLSGKYSDIHPFTGTLRQRKNLAGSKEPTEKLYSNAQLCHVQLIHLFYFPLPAICSQILFFSSCNRTGEKGLITNTKQVQKNWLHQQVTWSRSHWSYTIFLLSLPSSTYFSSAQCGRHRGEVPGCWQKSEIWSKRVGR